MPAGYCNYMILPNDDPVLVTSCGLNTVFFHHMLDLECPNCDRERVEVKEFSLLDSIGRNMVFLIEMNPTLKEICIYSGPFKCNSFAMNKKQLTQLIDELTQIRDDL